MTLPNDRQAAAAQIVQEWRTRHKDRALIFNRMEDVRRQYNGDVYVALPEIDGMEKPAIANLVAQGIDDYAMRVASVIPAIFYPALSDNTGIAKKRADERRRANLGWWQMNEIPTKMRRRSRHLIAYGCSPVSISPVTLDPNDKRKIPRWRVRNPLGSYPAPMIDHDAMHPTDCIFVDYRLKPWLEKMYPTEMMMLAKGSKNDTGLFTVLEYVDDTETVLVAVGKPPVQSDGWGTTEPGTAGLSEVLLDRIPNHAGICPVVIPGRITLDRLMGQFDQTLGMYQREAYLDALNTQAVFRDVFPDVWAQGNNPAMSPEIIEYADGATGTIGKVKNAVLVPLHATPGQSTQIALSNLERAQRLTASLPSEFGGESASNIRTGRRGAQVLSATVDMQLQEYQEIFARSLRTENEIAVRTMKAYYGDRPSMFFFSSDGEIVHNDYTPNDTFETALCTVKYPLPGADLQQLIVGIGQRVGLGEMSVETAMELDPFIEDPVAEMKRIVEGGLRKALESSLEQLVVSGQMTPHTLARILLDYAKGPTNSKSASIAWRRP